MLCQQHADAAGLSAESCAPLSAFRGAAEREAATFAALRADVEVTAQRLPGQIVSVLSGEVDAGQAALFARRFTSVWTLLSGMSQPEAVLLAVGLVMRASEVLSAAPPRALRIRAVVDFFYSQAALLHHRAPGAEPLDALVARSRRRAVADGIWHMRIVGRTDRGPVHANVLRVEGGRLETIDCRGQGSLAEVVSQRGAAAGVSGGFFLYSEPDIILPSRRTDPVGLLVHRGAVQSPPIWRRSALIERPSGGQDIVQVGLVGCVLGWPGGEQVRIEAVDALDATGVVAFTRAHTERSPPRTGESVAIVGDHVVARGRGGLAVPLAGTVVSFPGDAPRGERVRWMLPEPITEGIAGGPRLLRAGAVAIGLVEEDFAGSAPPITFSQDETFDQNLLPRMAAGRTAAGALIFIAIDGRNFERAPGMTLRQTAGLCATLGCVEAMNLDGGSSKRMVVGGELVDLPSTEVVSAAGGVARVRPVNTAVLLYPSGV
jgi:hypothetical protein